MLAPLAGVIGLSEMCFSGPVALGLVLLADDRGWGASGTGWMLSAFGAGAAAAALWITVLARVPHAGPSIIAALLVTAAATTALGHAPSLTTAIVLTVLIGLASGTTVTLTSALVQAEADPRYLGRVTSLTVRRVRRDQSAGGRAGRRGPGTAARPTPRHRRSDLTRSAAPQ